jgi:hypothetical protein
LGLLCSEVVFDSQRLDYWVLVGVLEETNADIPSDILEVLNRVWLQPSHLFVAEEGGLNSIDITALVGESPEGNSSCLFLELSHLKATIFQIEVLTIVTDGLKEIAILLAIVSIEKRVES